MDQKTQFKFSTKSGSLYEVDLKGQKVRRLTEHSTHRSSDMVKDEWYYFIDASPIMVGARAIFHFDLKDNPMVIDSPDGADPSLVTSEVVEIINNEN